MSKINLYQENDADIANPPSGAKTIYLSTAGVFVTKDPSGNVTPIEASPSNTAPFALGAAAAGTSPSLSRSDHVHSHGDQAGGSLHAVASASVPGFMSAFDKGQLDSLGSFLSINGGFRPKVNTVTAAITLGDGFVVVLANATTAAFTITLPPASAGTFQYQVKKIDVSSNPVTIDADLAETIDGALTYVLPAQYECVTLQSDGVSKWYVL